MNKKSKLLADLINKGILIKNKNKFYLKFDSFKLFEIDKIFLKHKDYDDILILTSDNIIFEYWIKQKIMIPPWHTHWFQLRDNFLLKLKNKLLKTLLDKAIKKAGTLNKLCKSLEMSTPSFYNVYYGKTFMISVRKLRKLLNYLNLLYIEFNNRIEYTKKGSIISIQNPIFPINLNSEHGAFILGAIVSDGCIYIDKKARGILRTKYSTSETESLKQFINHINRIYGKVHMCKEHIRNCEIIRIGSSIIGETLIKVGAILGHKAKVDGMVPWLIRLGSRQLKINYLRAVFSDEASIYIGKKPYSGYIILSRYKHINKLTRRQRDTLVSLERYMNARKFPTGHIIKSITIKKALEKMKRDAGMLTIITSLPNLLLGESKILSDLSIKHRLWSRNLNKTPAGNYSLCCDLFINKKSSIIKFYKEVGFSLSSKQEKLIKLVNKLENKNGFEII
ncbi:hypothetical protein AYK26_04200 [Euryarchaeota archaeon SM23-78]|nr:MAG: hypothetical protein AYK26_04200 [Euryarchaeota archaeon SM23-78]